MPLSTRSRGEEAAGSSTRPYDSRGSSGLNGRLAAAMQEEDELMREEDVHGSASTVDASVAQHRASESFVVHRNPAFEQQEGFATPNPLQSGRRGEGGQNNAQQSSSDDEDTSPDVVARRQHAQRNGSKSAQHAFAPVELGAERRTFLNTPSPQDKMVQCYVKREKDATGMYPQFKLYLQDGGRFLLAARRRKKSKTSNFLISLESDDLARKGGGYFGKLRGNYIGTEYVLYNNGLKPRKNVQASEERREMCAVLFKPTALDLNGGPRMMTVVVPFPREFDQRLGLANADPGLPTRWRAQKKGGNVTVIGLKNKKPVWDPVSKGYCLDFRGRITEPSVKNFQLVAVSVSEPNSRVVLQFGKRGDDTFALDFSHPLTPFQAFAIALSSVDGKLCYAV